MTLFQLIMAYSVAWWMVLFMVLPFGIKAPETPEKGHVPSAPSKLNIKRKFMITSVLSIIPVWLFKILYEGGYIGL